MKVYELAKEFDVRPRVVLTLAREMGMKLQNRLTRIDAEQMVLLREHLSRDRNEEETGN